MRSWIRSSVLRFATVGVANTGLDVAAFAVLVHLGLHGNVANLFSFSLGCVQSFLLNKVWTFGDHDWGGAAAMQAVRFAVVSLIGLGISSLSLAVFLTMTGPMSAKLASVLVTFATGYLLSRHAVFRPSPG